MGCQLTQLEVLCLQPIKNVVSGSFAAMQIHDFLNQLFIENANAASGLQRENVSKPCKIGSRTVPFMLTVNEIPNISENQSSFVHFQ